MGHKHGLVRAALLAGSLTIPLTAQNQEPVRPPAGNLGANGDALVKRAAARLFCLAVECEDWSLLFKWIGVGNAITNKRIAKKGIRGNPPPLAITGPNTTNNPSGGNTTVWTSSVGNNVLLQQGHFGVNGNGDTLFASTTTEGSETILAAALAHEATHFNDRYTFKNNKPATPADDKALACEEVKGAKCELKVLKAFKSGKCVTAAELATIKNELCRRITTITNFKKAQEAKCK